MSARERWHGTPGGYTNHRCRCDDCREAWRLRCLEYRHRTGRNRPLAEYLAELRSKPLPHGTASCYRNHRCRCDDCRSAASEARQRARLANPEREREYQRRYRLSRRTALQIATSALPSPVRPGQPQEGGGISDS